MADEKKTSRDEILLFQHVQQVAFGSIATGNPTGWHRIPKCRDGSRPPVRNGFKKRKRR